MSSSLFANVKALDMADAAVSYAQSFLNQLGELEIRDGVLHAGHISLQNDLAIVEMLKQKFGFGCTIFQGNVRIATTAVASNSESRALGTQANAQITQRVYRRGERFRGITRTLGKDWLIVYSPLRSSRGKIVGMLAAYRELVDFLDDLSVLDGTPEAILLHRQDGRLLDVNLTTCDMLGIDKQDLLAKANLLQFTQDITHRELLIVAKKPIHQPVSFEGFWRRADAFTFPVTLSMCRIPHAKETCILTIVRDFTEEHAARSKLNELNAKLVELNESLEEKVAVRTRLLQDTLTQRAAILNHLVDGLLAIDQRGTVQVANPAISAMMGWENMETENIPLRVLHEGLAEMAHGCMINMQSFTDTLFLPNDTIGEATVSPILSAEKTQSGAKRCIGCVVLLRLMH